jgi:serine/threonine protein kinase
MSQPSWIGQIIGGRYEILELVGQGGMSAVYKARDPNLQRVVAIKLIHGFLASDPNFKLRFKEEARAVAQLRHPNIVQVYDYNIDGDTSYMVQEFVPGETLQARLQRINEQDRCMPMEEVFKISQDVLNALGYAHQRGMIHRDIKPSNIMINIYGQAILMDFGIVKILGGESHTASGAVVGTAMYIPPEFIRGEKADERSDLYSFGVTLFEMVSGHPPYEADSAMTLMMMHLNDPIPDISNLRSDIPMGFPGLIERALAKERDSRFSSAAEIAAALDRLKSQVQDSSQDLVPQLEPSAETMTGSPARSVEDSFLQMPVKSGQSENLNKVQTSKIPSQPLRKPPSGFVPEKPIPANQPPRSSRQIEGSHPSAAPDKTLRILPYLIITGLVVLMVVFVLAGVFIGRMLTTSAGVGTKVASLSEGTPLGITVKPTLEPQTADAQSLAPIAASLPRVEPPADRHYAIINEITLDDQGHYVVDYETFGFTPAFPGEHIHFFFNTVSRDQAGPPGTGPWFRYGGPWPFTNAAASDRPLNASGLCVLVANPDHTPQPDSGNCWPLPDVPVLTTVADSACLTLPSTDSSLVAPLPKLTMLLLRGHLPQGGWWYVQNPANLDDSCWVPAWQIYLSGDESAVPDATPVPPSGN